MAGQCSKCGDAWRPISAIHEDERDGLTLLHGVNDDGELTIALVTRRPVAVMASKNPNNTFSRYMLIPNPESDKPSERALEERSTLQQMSLF